MFRTLWEEVYIAGNDYIAKLRENSDPFSIELSGQHYLFVLDKLIGTQLELAEVMGTSQPLPPLTWEQLKLARQGQIQLAKILADGREKAARSIKGEDFSEATASIYNLITAWQGIAPWDYERVVVKSDKNGDDPLTFAAEESVREVQRTTADRGEMAKVLDCLKEGGLVRQHAYSEHISLSGASGQSLGSVTPMAAEVPRRAGILKGEFRRVPGSDLELAHYYLTEKGRRFIDRFGAYGESMYAFVDLHELEASVGKL